MCFPEVGVGFVGFGRVVENDDAHDVHDVHDVRDAHDVRDDDFGVWSGSVRVAMVYGEWVRGAATLRQEASRRVSHLQLGVSVSREWRAPCAEGRCCRACRGSCVSVGTVPGGQ